MAPSSHHLLLATTVSQSMRFLRGQVRYLRECGFRVSLLSSPGSEIRELAQNEGATAIEAPIPRSPQPLSDALALLRILRIILDARPDAVCAGTPKAGLLVLLAAAVSGTPARIYYLRGLPYITRHGVRRQVLRLLEKVACRLAHRVVCVSPSLMAYVVESGVVAHEKAVVLGMGSSNGVDAVGHYNPDRFPPGHRAMIRAQLDIPDSSAVIGFVGRLVRDKGVLDLLEAWKSVSLEHLDNYLLLVGPPELEDSLPSEVLRYLRSHCRIRWVDSCTDAAPYYLAMDTLVHPSHREGFPNAPLEAAAMQLPVVTTDAIGCRDSVINEVTGLVVPTADVAALTAAVCRYLQDARLRTQHGEAGRLRVLRDFAPERIWQLLTVELRRLIDREEIPNGQSAGP